MHTWCGSSRNSHFPQIFNYLFLWPMSKAKSFIYLHHTQWLYFFGFTYLKFFFQFSNDSSLETMCENIFMWNLLPRFLEPGGVKSAAKANVCVWIWRFIGSRVPEAGVLGILSRVFVHTHRHTHFHIRISCDSELGALVMSSAWQKAFFRGCFVACPSRDLLSFFPIPPSVLPACSSGHFPHWRLRYR